ncbi:MAG: carbohydrate kinase [Ectothiorhodospiraceae bacterium]|nr:carbohydrate kinase [Ectothiorhodospiraceae bacterium]
MFGEVLFDHFPDGQSILGGAPFNVAWHLQGLGCSPLLLSSVGSDTNGDNVNNTLREWKMDVSGLQRCQNYPTGQVTVQLENGQPSYHIVPDQAYDHISNEEALRVVKKMATSSLPPSMIYHGSLALREPHCRKTLDILLKETNAPVFLDLNLREPWWESSFVESMLKRATWVKLNDEELCEVTGHEMTDGPGLQHHAKELLTLCGFERLIVTRGERGAFVLTADGIIEGSPAPVDQLVDTVGAGDAFCAVTMAGLLQDWPAQVTLDRALAFASAICQQRGATQNNPVLYNMFEETTLK